MTIVHYEHNIGTVFNGLVSIRPGWRGLKLYVEPLDDPETPALMCERLRRFTTSMQHYAKVGKITRGFKFGFQCLLADGEYWIVPMATPFKTVRASDNRLIPVVTADAIWWADTHKDRQESLELSSKPPLCLELQQIIKEIHPPLLLPPRKRRGDSGT